MSTKAVRGNLSKITRNIPDGSRVSEERFKKRHYTILLVVTAMLPPLFLLGRFAGTEPITGARIPQIPLDRTVGGVAIIAIVTGIAAIPQLPRRAKSSLASFSFMTAAAVLAYFSGGYIEAHFLYFVGVGVVALYEDWAPFAVAILYVALQHSVFGTIESFSVYNHPPPYKTRKYGGLYTPSS